MNVWDCGPFPVILRESGGYFGNWQGEPDHTYGEGLACNNKLKSTVLELIKTH
jgi:fructose-1,6-bisphosphatase/inositol monophosphatase family enzyme